MDIMVCKKLTRDTLSRVIAEHALEMRKKVSQKETERIECRP